MQHGSIDPECFREQTPNGAGLENELRRGCFEPAGGLQLELQFRDLLQVLGAIPSNLLPISRNSPSGRGRTNFTGEMRCQVVIGWTESGDQLYEWWREEQFPMPNLRYINKRSAHLIKLHYLAGFLIVY